MSFSQDFSWFFLGFSMAFRVFSGPFQIFPGPVFSESRPPVDRGRESPASLLMRVAFKIFSTFFAKFSTPRVPGKLLSESPVLGQSRVRCAPPGKSRARRVGLSRNCAATSSRKVVLPESRVPGKSLNEAPWIATLFRRFSRKVAERVPGILPGEIFDGYCFSRVFLGYFFSFS